MNFPYFGNSNLGKLSGGDSSTLCRPFRVLRFWGLELRV